MSLGGGHILTDPELEERHAGSVFFSGDVRGSHRLAYNYDDQAGLKYATIFLPLTEMDPRAHTCYVNALLTEPQLQPQVLYILIL